MEHFERSRTLEGEEREVRLAKLCAEITDVANSFGFRETPDMLRIGLTVTSESPDKLAQIVAWRDAGMGAIEAQFPKGQEGQPPDYDVVRYKQAQWALDMLQIAQCIRMKAYDEARDAAAALYMADDPDVPDVSGILEDLFVQLS